MADAPDSVQAREKRDGMATRDARVPAETRAAEAARLRRRERALTLYCQGKRVGAVADAMDVSERTIRRWVHDALHGLADETRAERAGQLLRAIEAQRAIVAAAWQAYEEERALPAEARRGQSARYLAIASAANRDIARLEGLYARITQRDADVRVTVVCEPDGTAPSGDGPSGDGPSGDGPAAEADAREVAANDAPPSTHAERAP